LTKPLLPSAPDKTVLAGCGTSVPGAWQEATDTVCPEEPQVDCNPADHQGCCEHLPPVPLLQHSTHPDTKGGTSRKLRGVTSRDLRGFTSRNLQRQWCGSGECSGSWNWETREGRQG